MRPELVYGSKALKTTQAIPKKDQEISKINAHTGA